MRLDHRFTPGRTALFLAACLVAVYPEVILGFESFYYRDFGLFGYPLASYHRACFWRGEIPLWNPYSNCGIPYLAQWNTMVLYPFSILYLVLPLPWSLNLFCLAHLVLAGAGMHALARRWTGRPLAGSVAGVGFALNGLALNCLMWPNNMAALAWMPVVILCVERAWTLGGKRPVVVAAAVGAVQMLAGAPEIVLFTWLILGVLCLAQSPGPLTKSLSGYGVRALARRVLGNPRLGKILGRRCGSAPLRLKPGLRTTSNVLGQTRPALSRRCLRLGCVGLLVLGLASAQLLPFLDLLVHSQRDAAFGGGRWSMPGWGWANLLVPLFRCSPSLAGVYSQDDQQWTSSYYPGIGMVLLALGGLFLHRSWRVWTLTALAVAGLLLAMGDNGYVLPLLKKVFPPLGFIRFPIKCMVLTMWAIPLLAAHGVAQWQRMRSERGLRRAQSSRVDAASVLQGQPAGEWDGAPLAEASRSALKGAFPDAGRPWLWTGGIMTALICVLLAVAWRYPFPGEVWRVTWSSGASRTGFLIAILALILWGRRLASSWVRTVIPWVVLVLLALDVLSHAPRQNPTVLARALEPGVLEPQPDLQPGQGRAMISPYFRTVLGSAGNPNAFQATVGHRQSWFPNWNLVDEVALVDGFFSLYLKHQREIWQALYGSLERYPQGLADFLGVTRISSDQEWFVWERRDSAKPWITAGLRPVIAPDSSVLEAMQHSDFDPGAVVYLSAQDLPALEVTRAARARVLSHRSTAHRIEAEIEAEEAAVVTIAQTYHHAWHATVDGLAVPLWRANHAFQALAVPAGRHRLELVYRDRAFAVGLAMSGSSGLVCLALWVRRPSRRKRDQRNTGMLDASLKPPGPEVSPPSVSSSWPWDGKQPRATAQTHDETFPHIRKSFVIASPDLAREISSTSDVPAMELPSSDSGEPRCDGKPKSCEHAGHESRVRRRFGWESIRDAIGSKTTPRTQARWFVVWRWALGVWRLMFNDYDGHCGWLTTGRFAWVLGVLIFSLYPGVIFGDSTFYYRDFGIFGYPLAHYHRESFWRGEIPLWNPLNNCGVPFLAQWNTMTLYPGTLLYLLLPLTWSLGVFCLAHMFWAGLGMFVLVRRWAGHSLAGAVAGVAFAFNGLTWHALMWPNNMAALGWMPWVVWLAQRAWRLGGGRVLFGAMGGAMQMLTGAPEIIFLTWTVVGVMCLVEVTQAFRLRGAPKRREGATAASLQVARPSASAARQSAASARRRPASRDAGSVTTCRLEACVTILRRFGLMMVLVAGLSAAQLLPFLDFLAHSQRHGGYGDGEWSMPGTGWANFVLPSFHTFESFLGVQVQRGQYWTTSYYLGAGVLALALFACWRMRQAKVWVLAALGLLGAILALGEEGGLFPLLMRHVPQLGFMRFPIKFVVLPVFVIPVLAGWAVREWLDPKPAHAPSAHAGKTLGAILLAITVLIAGLVWFALRYPMPQSDGSLAVSQGIMRALWLGALWAGLIGLRRMQGAGWQRMFGLGLLAVLWLDVRTHAWDLNPTVPRFVYASNLARSHLEFPSDMKAGGTRAMVSLEALAGMRSRALTSSADDFLGRRLALFGNCNLLDEVPKVNGFFSLYPAPIDRLLEALYGEGKEATPAMLDLLGVRCVTAPGGVVDWSPRTTAIPMVSAGQRPVFLSPESVLPALFDPSIDFRRTVILNQEARGNLRATHPAVARVRMLESGTDRLDMEVEAESQAMVVVTQSFYHPWRAYVNERPARLFEANLAFQALEVPPGKNRVRLVYEDRSFRAGMGLSLLSWLVCLGGAAWKRNQGHAPHRQGP